MPYISKESRNSIEFVGLDKIRSLSPGEMNYILTKYLLKYIKGKGLSYKTLNEVIGILECCKLEIYRKVVAKYEDEKEKVNGTIFEENEY